MNVQDFINNYQNKTNVGDTDANRGQCVGLVEVWLDTIGAPHIWGNAIDLLANADRNEYTVTMNTPDGTPSPVQPAAGDLVVFAANYGVPIDTDASGHVDIFANGDINGTWYGLDQNFPTGSDVHVQTHTWQGVTGWISPNILHPAPTPEPTPEPAPEAPVETPDPTPVAPTPSPSTPVPVTVLPPVLTTTPLPEPTPEPSDPVVVPVSSPKTTLLQKLESNVHLIVGLVAYVTTLVGALRGFLTASDVTSLLAVITASVSAVIHGKVTS